MSTRDAGKAKAEKARRESRANAWRQEVEARRAGSAEAAYARIERRESLQPGTVKKAMIGRRVLFSAVGLERWNRQQKA